MAKWTPGNSAPGTASGRGSPAPMAQADGVELRPQLLGRNVPADGDAGLELHPFGGHLLQAAVEDVLFQLEVGDAVAQQPAQAVVLLEERRPRGRRGPVAGRRPVRPVPSRPPPPSGRSCRWDGAAGPSPPETPARRSGIRCA